MKMLQINMQILLQAISSYHQVIFIELFLNKECSFGWFFLSLTSTLRNLKPRHRSRLPSTAHIALFAIYLEFSIGTAFLSLTKALLTACTLLRSLAFLLATTWGGFSLWGTCLYLELFSRDGRSSSAAAETRSKVQGCIFFQCVDYEEGLVPYYWRGIVGDYLF